MFVLALQPSPTRSVRVSDTIRATSFSRLLTYENCPHHAKLAYLDKVPELPRPTPPSGEHANDRGSRVHDACEAYVRGQGEMVREMLAFKQEFEHARNWFAQYPEDFEMEDLWRFDTEWNNVDDRDFENIWLRVKLDLMVWVADDEAIVVDYKTGKRRFNEVKHAQQLQLYLLSSFMRYPQLHVATAELWYLDQDELTRQSMTRKQALRYFRNFDERLKRMTSDTEFKPKPNGQSCKFCPYAPSDYDNKWVKKNGACEMGVA